jgi:hypothetical protein
MGFLPHLELTDTHLIFHESQSFSEKFDLKRENPRIQISYDQRLFQIHSGSEYYYFLYENGRSKRLKSYKEFLDYKWRFMCGNIIAVKTAMRKSQLIEAFCFFHVLFVLFLFILLTRQINVHEVDIASRNLISTGICIWAIITFSLNMIIFN